MKKFLIIKIGGLGLLIAPALHAATFAVTKTEDTADGRCEASDCSLREAIIAANLTREADRITVPIGTYKLIIAGTGEDASTTGDLDITNEVSINGGGAAGTIINAKGIDRAIDVNPEGVEGMRVTITNLAVKNGSEDGDGGGGILIRGGIVTLFILDICDNVTTGDGGGINVTGGIVTISRSVLCDNSANNGGGVSIDDLVTFNMNNSTVSGNSAVDGGGGLLADGEGATYSLNNVTMTDNTADSDTNDAGDGGGIDGSGVFEVRNSIIGGNRDSSSGTVESDCSTENLDSGGYNLIQDTTGCTIGGVDTGNITGVDPGLEKLADNGGPTPTHALPPASPAIDGGDPGGCNDHSGTRITNDQRGGASPVDGNGDGTAVCDIGAFESSLCGDGTEDSGEECDDGNLTDGDGCSAACAEESVDTGSGCGLLSRSGGRGLPSPLLGISILLIIVFSFFRASA